MLLLMVSALLELTAGAWGIAPHSLGDQLPLFKVPAFTANVAASATGTPRKTIRFTMYFPLSILLIIDGSLPGNRSCITPSCTVLLERGFHKPPDAPSAKRRGIDAS